MGWDLSSSGLFSANNDLECVKSFREAIDVFKLELLDLIVSVNCDAVGYEVLWVDECNAIALFWVCEMSLIK